MKNRPQFLFFTLMLLSVLHFQLPAQPDTVWTSRNASKWFHKKEWLPGGKTTPAVQYDNFGRIIEQDAGVLTADKPAYLDIKNLKPHSSIDKVQFAKAFHANRERWNTAFSFLQTTNLATLTAGKHSIDGDNVYAVVTEGPGRNADTTKWEGHRNYADIHYVIRGQERIGVAKIQNGKVVTEYDKLRDIRFYNAKGANFIATPDNLFIFFPNDLHRPNLHVKPQETIKKIVVKVRLVSQ